MNSKCKHYIEKQHNILDGYEGSCTSPKSKDAFCPYYGGTSKCSIAESLELSSPLTPANTLDFSYYKGILLTLIGKFPAYSSADIARILASLALKADEKATFNLIDQRKLKYKPNSITK